MSIRTRLTLWYGAVMSLLLLIFGSILYGTLRQSLMSGLDRRLLETGRDVQATAQSHLVLTFPFNWQEVVTLAPPDVFATPDIFIQIWELDGTVAARSANLRQQLLPPPPPAVKQQVLAGRPRIETVEVGPTRLRIRSERIMSKGRPVGLLQVAASLRPVDEAMNRLLVTLLIGGGAGLLLALGGGAWLARQAMKPITQAIESARRISRTENLSERIPAPGTNDEIGRLVSTFNEMLDRLQRLFLGQQRFITDVSHELRTPLAAIRGNLEVLQRGARDDPEILRDSLQDIEREVLRLSRMVADLLVLSRADAGVHLERRPVELERLLLEIYREATHLSRGVQVRLGREDQVQVLGDEDRLKQVLLNLVDNALKYTPAGGTVTLALYAEGPWACLSVSDTGSGIPEEEQARIFDRFYRGKEGQRRGGLGLGLSIARWIVEEHGGEITLTSRPGEGSTFTVWLPRMTEEMVAGRPEPPARSTR